MAYNTAKMITDADGKLIPQMYNPDTDQFEPLTPDAYNNINVNSGSLSVDNFPVRQDVQLMGSSTTLNTQIVDETGIPLAQPIDLQYHNLDSTTAIPVNQTNDALVEHVLVDNVTITATTSAFSSAIDAATLKKYKSLIVVCRDSTDVEVSIDAWGTTDTSGKSAYRYYDETAQTWSLASVNTGTATSTFELLLNTHPTFGKIFDGLTMFRDGLRFRYTAATVPEAGTFTLVVYGVTR